MVERWSPKPNAIGSSPIFPANIKTQKIMSKTYLRVSKILRILNDGSSHYKYDNGCRNNLFLYVKDHRPILDKNEKTNLLKKSYSSAQKYKKKFGLRKK
jgi:hypothetical protein